MRKHMITHYPDRFFKCMLCDKKFPSTKQRKGHMKTSHPEFKPIECEMCNKKFDKQSTYDCHVRINHLNLMDSNLDSLIEK